MPELPEVQTILSDLQQANLIGCKIEGVKVYWPKTISRPSVSQFCHLLMQKQITGLSRRGKYLILNLSHSYFLCIHLRMTGRLHLVDQETIESSHIRLRIDLDNHQSIHYYDTRKFGRWSLIRDLESITSKMGPEPLSPLFTFEMFWPMLCSRSRRLKSLLLDQNFLVGLGNIYVDEALWEASLHPLQLASDLTLHQAQNLHRAIIHVLKRGIESRGTTLGSGRANYYRLNGSKGGHQQLLNVFRRAGKTCPRCGYLIERLVIAQRGTHICPNCQLLPKTV